MDHERRPQPRTVDVTVPSVARMHDWFLGGKNSYPADREACRALLQGVPSTRELVLANRQFLHRVVNILADQYGVRQFLDHGSGLPWRDNVHQVAQRVDPEARVVYVDNDPAVLAHGRALLAENTTTAVIQADIRDTGSVFENLDTCALIDLEQPVAALFVSVLHCLPDTDDPAAILRRVAGRLAPGSFLVACQLISPHQEVRDFVTTFMGDVTQGNWGRVREEHEVATFFDGMHLLTPGLVEVSAWRPDSDLAPKQRTSEWTEFGGVAQLR
ncbi:SAM-dependent methyltransferase [[Kitasatospora] papulosa]|uniref:SAM-dependent methyltransferase n=1 Tax=Streptomyces TaxID=1883 RepID=UPI0025B3E01E|nr:SAM-dependent methyltransferase [Streptomyces sp. P9-2B-1]WJY35435.1 SAM-dependent methyltransferase [Streptomyces sp. P9-2B-1]